MPVSQDAYVSFRGAQRRDFGTIRGSAPLVFVDLDGDDVEVLRSIPASFARQRHGLLLLRVKSFNGLSEDLIEQLKQVIGRWRIDLAVGILHQPVGAVPTIVSLAGGELSNASDYAARARAVELEALLDFGQAIWRPRTYHYRLITGEHASAYIKMGDAIRGPRDADVLASWLSPHVGERVGLVIDTGTLTPLAQSLRLTVAQAGGVLGPVSVLDQQSRTGTDIDVAIDTASGDDGRVLIVLSISSSGSLLERVLGALDRKSASLAEPKVAVLVDKSGAHASGEFVDVWTPLPGQEPLVERGARDQVGCLLCRDPKRAPVVPINPFSFDAMAPNQLQQVVPDTRDPLANRQLWEAANRTNAISVERPAHAAVRRHRSDKIPMGIVLKLDRLITDEALRHALVARIRHLQETERMSSHVDLVLMAEHEMHQLGDFWAAIQDTIAPDVETPAAFHPDEDFDEELVAHVKAAGSVLIFGLGSVTGASLQRALVGVQDARRAMPEFDLQGFVVHARPATTREWETLQNSFGYDGEIPYLHFGWKSILPDRSPLREEGVLLRRLDTSEQSGLSSDARDFVERRLKLCQREITQDEFEDGGESSDDDTTLLWGTVPDQERLTPNSLYGQGLDAITTYVAVGSAMAAALSKPDTSLPQLRVFEIAALARSYYDPIILCCFFRWMRPHEAFWGWTGAEAITTVTHIIDRAEGKHRKLIVPEMLLAAAQGKLTYEASAVVRDIATSVIDDQDFAEVRAPLEAGLALLERGPTPPPTEPLGAPSSPRKGD